MQCILPAVFLSQPTKTKNPAIPATMWVKCRSIKGGACSTIGIYPATMVLQPCYIPLADSDYFLSCLLSAIGVQLFGYSRTFVWNTGMVRNYCSSHRIEYDSRSLRGICSSVAVLRQSLMAARTSSIISDASWLSSM